MKRLLLIPFLFLFNSQIIAEVKTDVRLLCLRTQRAYDVSFIASRKANNYQMDIWLEAYTKEKKKFEDKGERMNMFSVHDEPYKSIKKKFEELNDLSSKTRYAYAQTLVPILELAGYERPEFYVWYYTSNHAEIERKHKMNYSKVEELTIADDYFSHTGSGNDTRDELCKLYGYEFNKRYSDFEFKEKHGL